MNNSLTEIKRYVNSNEIKNRFHDILGKKAPQFMASLVNTVGSNPALSNCNPNSIMSASFVAAALDLPIDPNLGFAAIIPYSKNVKNPKTGRYEKQPIAQFQIMTKGFVQLGIRTGQYERIYASVVYKDELKSFNPITGECLFVDDFNATSQRKTGNDEDIAGFYAWFKLKTGYKQEFYMSKEEVLAHARTYSTSFRYDQKSGTNSSVWSTNFKAMGKKTVIKLLLSHWGILSIAMQRAILDDQKTFDINGRSEYGDNKPDIQEELAVDNNTIHKEKEIIIEAEIEEFDMNRGN